MWEKASQYLEVHWDAVPEWFFYDSEFDGKTHWTLSDYAGWVELFQELADVFGEEDGAWIVAAAVAAAKRPSFWTINSDPATQVGA